MPSVICPFCRHPIDFDPSRVGERLACPNCGRAVEAVTLDAAGATLPAAADGVVPGQAPPVAGSSPPTVTTGWSCHSCGRLNAEPRDRCEQCGAPRAIVPLSGAQTDGLAVAAFVMGLVACVPVLTQVLAVTMGIFSLKRIRHAHGRLTGGGLAWAGLVLGLTFGLIWTLIGVSAVRTGTWRFTVGGPARARAVPGVTTLPGSQQGVEDDFPEVAENLDHLGKALKGYLAEWDRLPSSLADLAPSYANRDRLVYTDGARADRPFSYVAGLDPKRGDPNTIVVYTDPLVPPPPAVGYRLQYVDPENRRFWKKGLAPKGIKRLVLQLNGQTALLTFDEFDRRMGRQEDRAGKTEPDKPTRADQPGAN